MRPTPSGRQPHSRSVVGASIPVRDNGYASAGAPKGFSLVSLETFGHRSWRETHGNCISGSHGKNSRLSSAPLSRRIRHLPFFPCMNPKNFL